MIHRHGFPLGTDRAHATQVAVAAYHALGGENRSPLVEHVEGEELVVVVRTAPKSALEPVRRMDGIEIRHGDVPDELYDMLKKLLGR